jgi:hypothetical protein
MSLALGKLFVMAASVGGGLIVFGASWRLRRPPTYIWNRRLFDQGFRAIRYGSVILLVALIGLAAVRLL